MSATFAAMEAARTSPSRAPNRRNAPGQVAREHLASPVAIRRSNCSRRSSGVAAACASTQPGRDYLVLWRRRRHFSSFATFSMRFSRLCCGCEYVCAAAGDLSNTQVDLAFNGLAMLQPLGHWGSGSPCSATTRRTSSSRICSTSPPSRSRRAVPSVCHNTPSPASAFAFQKLVSRPSAGEYVPRPSLLFRLPLPRIRCRWQNVSCRAPLACLPSIPPSAHAAVDIPHRT